MKRLFFALMILSGYSSACFAAPAVTNFAILVSRHYTSQEITAVLGAICDFVTDEAAEGSTLTVIDGEAIQQIATFEVKPLRIPSRRARLIQQREPMSTLAQWFRDQKSRPADAALDGTATLDYVEAMDFATRFAGHGPWAILIAGSPLNRCLREPSESMTGTPPQIPTRDGIHKRSKLQTHYGTIGRETMLTNCLIHLCYLDENRTWPKGYPAQKEYTRNFLAEWVSAQGGKLVDFTPDLTGFFKLGVRGDLGPVACDPVVHSQKAATMLVLRPDDEDSLQHLLQNPPPIRQGAVTSLPIPPQLSGKTGIGIQWQTRRDNDLHLVSRPGADEISYRNPRTPEGFLHEDLMHATGNDFEFVELNGLVDWGTVQAWINCYSSADDAANAGTVCVLTGTAAYFGTFRIAGGSGNCGPESADARADSPFWTKINIRSILGH